jgi:hypothetical protein
MLPSLARLVQRRWLDPFIDAPAAVFALGERLRAFFGLELIILLHRYPGEFEPLLPDLLVPLSLLFLELRELLPSGLPFLTVPILCSGISSPSV